MLREHRSKGVPTDRGQAEIDHDDEYFTLHGVFFSIGENIRFKDNHISFQ